MSSNKAKLFLLLLILGLITNQVDSSESSSNYARNGIVYVLLSDDFNSTNANCYGGLSGVWRLSDDKGEPTNAWKLYSDVTAARGLTVDQAKDTSVYLLNSAGSDWATMSAGLTPDISTDDDSCDLWVAVVDPNDSHISQKWVTGTSTSSKSYVSGAYAKGRAAHNTSYFKNEPGTHNGTGYDYLCKFNGPTGVKYFDGSGKSSSTLGTPMWKGSGNGEIRHKNYSTNKKIIIPCNFGAIGYYLYATSKNPDYNPGTEMDGQTGRKKDGSTATKPTYIYSQANKFGDAWPTLLNPITQTDIDNQTDAYDNLKNNTWSTRRGNKADHYWFGCIVKMIYAERKNTLNLRQGLDQTNSNWPTKQIIDTNGLNNVANASGLLETTDYKAMKYFGKWCGDNCIPGDGLDAEAQNPIINSINVVTTTTDCVYGFNPKGSPNASDKKAMLRKVDLAGGSHSAVNISNFNQLTNRLYLTGKGSVDDLKNFGASSNFANTSNNYLYGSFADLFVVQDSWWGLGGIAYEYDKSTQKVKKLDYMNSTNGLPLNGQSNKGEEIGQLKGNIDAIAVDGDAYLYVLKTECEPKDDECQTANLNGVSSSRTKTIGGVETYIDVEKQWYRLPEEGPATKISSPSQSNDFKNVKISQKVYKRVYRYKEGQSLTLDNDIRGQIEVGTDYYVGRVFYPDYKYVALGPQQSTKTKAKDLRAELAVVNVADAPVTFNGTDDHYIAVLGNKSFKSGDRIAEEQSLTFKIEGYKPKLDDGNQRDFKSMGSYRLKNQTVAESIKVNNIHNNSSASAENENSGTMLFDENGDGVYTGFPSSMFESSAHPTTVTWYIYQVEDDEPKNIISTSNGIGMAKVVKTYPSDPKSSSSTTYCNSSTFTFNQPGRYIVQARMKYYIFKNFGSALRPTDLEIETKNIVTKPFLVNVFSSDLVNPPGTTFITNVTRSFDNKKEDYSGVSKDAVESGCDLDTAEGKENKNHFGDLRIEFDAEFFGLKEDYSSGKFQTYDGIGVWDYNYYQSIYKKMSSSYGINTINDDIGLKFSSKSATSASNHVYNYINDSDNKSSIYNPENDNFKLTESSYQETYNPGFYREFTDSTKTYRAGTEAKGSIYDCDKAFIQWNLYLRKLSGGADYIPQQKISNTILERGELIASGTILEDSNVEDCKFDPIDDSRGINRKYHVGFTIKDIDSKINVPRDPNEYVIDIELIYPRVFWKLDKDSDKIVYSSSMVPFNSDNGGAAPIHVLTNLNTTKATNNRFNQSELLGGINDDDESVGSFTLCVRDSVRPTFFYRDETNKTDILKTDLNIKEDIFEYSNNKNYDKNKGIIYESTGEPLGEGVIDYGVSDNNPFMRFKKPDNKKISSIIATDTTTNNLFPEINEELLPEIGSEITEGIKIYYEQVSDTGDFFDDSRTNKKVIYNKSNSDYRNIKVRQTTYKDTPEFYKNNNWKISVTYSDTIPNMSSLKPCNSSEIWDFKTSNIKRENWIGKLNYAAYGSVYDGYGTGRTEMMHYFYASDFDKNKEPKYNENQYPSPSNTIIGIKNENNNLLEIGNIIKVDKIDIETRQYLERLDNDPPSIGIQLLSQSDNRKWDFQLIEGIEDSVAFASTTANLANCRLYASCSKLLENEEIKDLYFESLTIPGVTNVYSLKEGEKPEKQNIVMPSGENGKDLSIVNIKNINGYKIPTFRKSSRLIVNVDIFDNCGFKELGDCSIEVTGLEYDFGPNNTQNITNRKRSHKLDGKIEEEFETNPRATFVVDLPSQVKGGEQVTITVHAKDHIGNQRSLVIPIAIQESSYDARVIEHSEQKY